MSDAGSIATVFMGSDPIALPYIRVLEERVPAVCLKAVFTQPDRPKGRGQRLHANEIKTWALERGLSVRQPVRCGPGDTQWIRDEGIDLILVMAYGQLLKPEFLEAPKRGIYNLHTSLLPKFRGASPVHTALAEGETTTGVTLMRIVPKMDAGPIIDQEPVTICPRMTAPELLAAQAQACIPLVQRGLARILSGEAAERDQDPDAVTYCRRIFKEDAALDFNAPAPVLDRRIRAFQPWPGATFTHAGTALKIGEAMVREDNLGTPGTIRHLGSDRIAIACGGGALELIRLQRPGGRMLPVGEFLRGFELPEGAVVESAAMAPLVGRRPFPWKWRPGDAVDKIV